MQLSIGADPEVFVSKAGRFVSGHTFECGTKEHPMKTPNGSVQVDGLALEFNVTPAQTRGAFIQNVRSVFSDLDSFVRGRDADASLVAVPTVTFGQDYINSLPDEVQALGCNPDFNAYTYDFNSPPDGTRPFRTGAGHVHLGFRSGQMDSDHFHACCSLVQNLDFYLGLPSLGWDGDSQRRELYGAAGAFRPKPYGLEYRVLSNAWVSNPKLIGYVFDQTKTAYDRWTKGERLHEEFGDFAKDCISGSILDWRDRSPEIAERIS